MPSFRTCEHCGGSGCSRCGGTGKQEWRNSVQGGRYWGPPTCFPAGTLIKTPTGFLDIASASKGDWVLAFDPYGAVLRPRRILKVCHHGKQRVWEIRFADGSSLRTTASHSLSVAEGWKRVRHLRAGDIVRCLDATGEFVGRRVVCSSSTAAVEEVFNLIVGEDFTFVADGVVAHSFSYFRRLRAMGWTVYAAITARVYVEPNAAPHRAGMTGSQG